MYLILRTVFQEDSKPQLQTQWTLKVIIWQPLSYVSNKGVLHVYLTTLYNTNFTSVTWRLQNTNVPDEQQFLKSKWVANPTQSRLTITIDIERHWITAGNNIAYIQKQICIMHIVQEPIFSYLAQATIVDRNILKTFTSSFFLCIILTLTLFRVQLWLPLCRSRSRRVSAKYPHLRAKSGRISKPRGGHVWWPKLLSPWRSTLPQSWQQVMAWWPVNGLQDLGYGHLIGSSYFSSSDWLSNFCWQLLPPVTIISYIIVGA
jgi:hypothetical protein